MTLTQINLNSADYRSSFRSNVKRACDGLQFPCDGEGRYVITLSGPNYDRTPTYITTTLCEACKAEWDSWQETKK